MEEKIILRARKFGIISFWVVIFWTFLNILLGVIGINLNDFWLNIASFIIGLLITLTYTVMLVGIFEIAKRSAINTFILNIKVFIGLTIFSGVVISLSSLNLIPEPFLFWYFILQLLICFALGLISIRIADNFNSLEPKLGKVAKSTAIWHRIAGWLLVSIILIPLGIILSLVADFYMWKMLGEYLRRKA